MAERAKKADSMDPEMVELREEFEYATQEKADIRKAGSEDMRAINGDGWDPEERRLREEAGRPCIWLDELGQYVNQLINEVRQNKRSIKVAPQGRGATDKTAEVRQNLIRQIEYRSNAQQAYAVMFENAAQRGYGYLRIKPEYTSHRSNDQELRIEPIPNPDLVVEDPGFQRTDGSDWKFLYFGEEWTHAAFKRKFGEKAQISDFAGALQANAKLSTWVKNSRVIVAERWRVVTKKKKLYMVTPPAPPAGLSIRPLPAPPPFFALEDDKEFIGRPPGSTAKELREVDYPSVKKQITNGIEILEETDWKGASIPFVACYGKILYLEESSIQKRVIHSLIRLARAAAMKHAYIDTCEVEVIGAVPRNSWLGYEGQFAEPDEWQKANHEPVVMLQAKVSIEGLPPGTILPLPTRQPWDPPLQNLEMAKESARRAIQAAIGVSPLPTSAQKHNEKSGVALREMKDSGQMGSFHFVDHFDDALMRTGAILDENLEFYYDSIRTVTVRKPDDQTASVRINDPADPESVSTTDGQHDVTLSVGPQQASERQAASDFADTFIGSPLLQLLPQPLALKLVALAIRLKNVGPTGDEMADTISPKPKEGEQQGPTPEQASQMQAQIQELTQKLQEAEQALQADKVKAQATLDKAHVDAGSREKIAAAQIEAKRMDNETKLAVAELGAKVDRLALFLEERARLGVQQHEAEQAGLGRQHDVGMAAMTGEQQAQASAQGHAQTLEQGGVSHGQALEAGEIEAQRAAEQAAAEQAAAQQQGAV